MNMGMPVDLHVHVNIMQVRKDFFKRLSVRWQWIRWVNVLSFERRREWDESRSLMFWDFPPWERV